MGGGGNERRLLRLEGERVKIDGGGGREILIRGNYIAKSHGIRG